MVAGLAPAAWRRQGRGDPDTEVVNPPFNSPKSTIY